ncbi:MAG TPA: hypothetical protein PKY59_11560 [Pyrinomonadaceae bacterium]|nr:hypothetical protein [Pyrinomonadaceae bacterium]
MQVRSFFYKFGVRASIARCWRVKAIWLGKTYLRREKSIYAVKSSFTARKVHLRCEKSIYGVKSSFTAGKIYLQAEKFIYGQKCRGKTHQKK